MRISRRTSIVAALALLAGGAALLPFSDAVARPNAARRPTVIAVINLNKVLDTLDEKNDRERELEKFMTELEDSVNKEAKEAKQKQEELKILPQNGPAYIKTREELLKLTARVQADAQAAKILAEDKKKVMQLDLFRKINDATREYAKREGIDLVLNDDSNEDIPDNAPAQQAMGAMAGRRIIFSSNETEISDAVSQTMNLAYKATGATPASTPAKPAAAPDKK